MSFKELQVPSKIVRMQPSARPGVLENFVIFQRYEVLFHVARLRISGETVHKRAGKAAAGIPCFCLL